SRSLRSVVFLLLLAACAATQPGSNSLSHEQIAEILAASDRSAADRTNDVRRKPAEMLAFIGPRPGMTVLDISAGGGNTTELLARAVGPGGRVYAQTQKPSPRLAERLKNPALG